MAALSAAFWIGGKDHTRRVVSSRRSVIVQTNSMTVKAGVYPR